MKIKYIFQEKGRYKRISKFINFFQKELFKKVLESTHDSNNNCIVSA